MFATGGVAYGQTVEIGNRLEPVVDRYLVDRMENVSLRLHEPVDRGPVLVYDKPWEGGFSFYTTVVRDGDMFRMYYRGSGMAGNDNTDAEVTCYAESRDGVNWTRPSLDLHEIAGIRRNNVILAQAAPFTHNFTPFLDARPNVSTDQRYKAIAGNNKSGLFAYVSADGIRWRQLGDAPVYSEEGWVFDSQNVCFWSEHEQQYVMYYRKVMDRVRAVARITSEDFVEWSDPVLMSYSDVSGGTPTSQLYTSQTHPYFRAPHIYIATAARFMPKRQVISADEAATIGVDPKYFGDVSDSVFMSTRDGLTYDRTFLESFIRPGWGHNNWVSRTNFPALNVVQTGENEMSIYVNCDYAQPTAHLRRYTLRLDGFASINAGFAGGEFVTRPLIVKGNRLMLNFATSAAGSIRVEVQDAAGKPLPGYALEDAQELVGNEISKAVRWKSGDVLHGADKQPIRLRFVMQDADIFALRFD